MLLFLLIFSAVIGLLVSSVTDAGILFPVVTVFLFVCGLPAALGMGIIHDEISYMADRADIRALWSDISADARADEHELAEDLRTDRLIKSGSGRGVTYNDNRQVHYHGRLT